MINYIKNGANLLELLLIITFLQIKFQKEIKM